MSEGRIGKQATLNSIAAQKLRDAVALESTGKYESALIAIEEALAIQQNYIDAWIVKGVINGKIGKYSDALKYYDRAIEIDSQCIDVLKLKSATLVVLGLHERALECLKSAVELDPADFDLHLNMAGIYQRGKRYDEAFQCYQQAKRQKPNDPRIDYLIGIMWGNKADYEKALISFELALRLKPDFVDALLGKGLMMAKLGRNDEAKACANRLLEIKSDQSYQAKQTETAMSRSQNEEIRNQYLAAQKKFTSQYAPNKV